MSGKRNFKSPKLTFGVGLNDADYVTQRMSSGSNRKLLWTCPFFLVWKNMMKRAYSAVEHSKRPSYIGATVCGEWHSFSAFKAWMESQKWEGRHLDKDLISKGSKIYSPETCCFVSMRVNSFLTDSHGSRGELPIGVSFHKDTGKYVAQVSSNPAGSRYIGLFDCPEEAHRAWRVKKHEIALSLSREEPDPLIAEALANRYAESNCHSEVTL